MPSWARNKISLNDSLRKQFSGTEKHSAKTIFGPFPKTADLDQLFGTVNRVRCRIVFVKTNVAQKSYFCHHLHFNIFLP